MSRRRDAEEPNQAKTPPEPDEVGVAVRSVLYELTHDLSDTAENLRDAVAFAPLALIKLAQRSVSALSLPRHRAALLAGGAVALLLAGLAWRRRKRS